MENLEQELKNLEQELTKIVKGFKVLVKTKTKTGTTYEKKRLKDILPPDIYNRLLVDTITSEKGFYNHMASYREIYEQNLHTCSYENLLVIGKTSTKCQLSEWVEDQTFFDRYDEDPYNYKLPENISNIPKELE